MRRKLAGGGWNAVALGVGMLGLLAWGGRARAAQPFSCGGFAMLGGAQLICSHVDPRAPAQMCTYSWALTTVAGTPSIADGSFLLVPGVANATVYQGSGFSGELSPPIVLCQGKRSR